MAGNPQRISFIYPGRRGSALECTLALHAIALRMGWDSQIVLSRDNTRAGIVRELYPEARFADFFSPRQIASLRRSLAGRMAFFTMMSPKMLPLFLSLPSRKIFYFHATYDYSYSPRTARDALNEALHWLLIRNSTVAAATQPGLARQIRKHVGVDALVLPHPPYSPIRGAFFSGEKAVKLPFGKEEYFLNFGEIARESKGTGLLLEAVRGTGLQVVLAGRRDGVKPARNLFHINRWVDDAELYWLVKNCRAVVLPYMLRSQFSGCLALAFHFRKPVIAPDTETFSGWVEEGKTGWLFSHSSAASLRSRMLEVSRGDASFSAGEIARVEKENEKRSEHGLCLLANG